MLCLQSQRRPRVRQNPRTAQAAARFAEPSVDALSLDVLRRLFEPCGKVLLVADALQR